MAKILVGATAEELAEEIDGFFMGTDRVWETLTHAEVGSIGLPPIAPAAQAARSK